MSFRYRVSNAFLLAIAFTALSSSTSVLAASALNVGETMRFAAEMAERGSWHEARYRWELIAKQQPDDSKVINNLAVAHEVMGDTQKARELYRKAAENGGGDPAILENLRRFAHFWRQIWEQEGDTDAYASLQGGEFQESKKKTKGKVVRVSVGLPVPARLEIRGDETLLVTSFMTGETVLLDTNREVVRYLRSEFRKDTNLDVLDINPPPAIPEQTVEDLLANLEFWRYLGRNFEAELIVSGVLNYNREDISTFQDVDIVSERTGQKVRQNRFVEQERFLFELDLFFIDGKTGSLLFRDRLQRAVVFQGIQNDPISAFYALSDSIASDVLAVVSMRIRQDTRLIFKK